jgi:hypothetical protein
LYTLLIWCKETAAIIPKIPKEPTMKLSQSISNGCELTLLKKIIGWDKLLSIADNQNK